MTEVWWRNPYNYIRELAEVGIAKPLIAWDRGVLVKRRIDPVVFQELHFGAGVEFRTILIGDQGTAEIDATHDLSRPLAVYPTWTYGDEPQVLAEMIERPVADDMANCLDIKVPVDERPVYGQEHRVVVTNVPPMSTGPGKRFVAWLRELQEDNPECIVHLHGVYSFRTAFGMGLRAADMDPRTTAQKGNIQLAAGHEMPYEKVQKKASWVTAMGMTPGDLEVPRLRCIFNIKSGLWAAANYDKLPANFFVQKMPGAKPVDSETPDAEYEVPTTRRALPVKVIAKPGDKVACNLCSLQLDCKQARAGAVCTLPDGEAAELAKFFKTRDSDKIIDGLGTLMAFQTRRLERAAADEEVMGELDPEVTKLVTTLFNQGVSLAKLVNPNLRGGVKVNVGVVNGQATVTTASSPLELTGQVVRALEMQGIPREKITPELVEATLRGMAEPESAQRAIEGTLAAEKE